MNSQDQIEQEKHVIPMVTTNSNLVILLHKLVQFLCERFYELNEMPHTYNDNI